jgi:hypothetical protein
MDRQETRMPDTNKDLAAANPQALVQAASTDLSGGIDVEVVIGGKTYDLAVGIPTSSGAAYTFSLTKKEGGVNGTLADFAFVDGSNFRVAINMPSIPASEGGPSISGGFRLQQGTVPGAAPSPT